MPITTSLALPAERGSRGGRSSLAFTARLARTAGRASCVCPSATLGPGMAIVSPLP